MTIIMLFCQQLRNRKFSTVKCNTNSKSKRYMDIKRNGWIKRELVKEGERNIIKTGRFKATEQQRQISQEHNTDINRKRSKQKKLSAQATRLEKNSKSTQRKD